MYTGRHAYEAFKGRNNFSAERFENSVLLNHVFHSEAT